MSQNTGSPIQAFLTRSWDQVVQGVRQGSRHLPGRRLILRTTLRTKLLSLVISISLGSVAVVGVLSWDHSRTALTDAVFNQLTGVRTSRAYQIESLFQRLRDHVFTLSEDRMVVEAMIEFNRTFRELNAEYVPPNWNEALLGYYTDEFFPRLAQNLSGELDFQNYRPSSQAAQYLQYHFIANNPNPLGEKDQLVDPGDNSDYSDVHQKYHTIFRNLIQKFGYYDLFLVNPHTGDIVYTVYKETDYATSLQSGPYAESGLARVVRAVQENPEPGSVQIVDFRPYRPSFLAPVSFLAAPIYNGPHLVGVLAIQLPIDEINAVMTGNFNWEDQGLGESGEVYLIGSDLTMRSISRFLVEDKQGYLEALRNSGTPEQTVKQIDRFDTSILLQPVETEAARESFNSTGIRINPDYRDVSVLSSYSPLQIEGLRWAVLAEIDLAEAYQPVGELQFLVLVAAVILVLASTALATVVMERLLLPLQTLIRQAQRASQEDDKVVNEQEINQEFGELSIALQELVGRIRKQSTVIHEQARDNQTLLLNLMPAALVEKVQRSQGEPVVESVNHATIIALRLTGLPLEAGDVLTEVWERFDRLAEQYEVDRVQTFGNRYLAACGLTRSSLGHSQRAIRFAQEAIQAIQKLEIRHRLELSIGVATGSLMAGVWGGERIRYDVWGEPLDQAVTLSERAGSGTILLTQAVYDQLSHLESMELEPPFEQMGQTIPVWKIRSSSLIQARV